MPKNYKNNNEKTVRKEDKDFISKDFLLNAEKSNQLNLNLVCSRLQKTKFYVQNFLMENQKIVKELIFGDTKKNGVFFI